MASKTDQVWQFIADYARANACVPNYREIAEGVKFESTNSVSHHIHKLVREGRVYFPKKGAAYRITNARMIVPFK